MNRILSLVIGVCLLALPLSLPAQEVSIGINFDGSGSMTVKESGQENPTVYPLSQKAGVYLIETSLEELIFAETQGKTAMVRFQGNDADVAVYQAALGMTAEQLALRAKLQAEKDEASFETARPLMEKIVQFDQLTPEESEAFDREYRSTTRNVMDGDYAILSQVLTPEQLRRMQELELVLPSFTGKILGDEDSAPFVNLDAYNALELSEEQKKQLTEIQKESGKETADFMKDLLKKNRQQIIDGKTPTEEDLKALAEKGKTMKARIKARVLALLTAEQTAKYEKLLAEWPKKLEQLKADWIAKQAEKKPEDDEWKKSWKPGDPLPEGAVPPKRPRRAFPFGG